MAARANVTRELPAGAAPTGLRERQRDGVNCAGKTIFADALAVELRGAGRDVVRRAEKHDLGLRPSQKPLATGPPLVDRRCSRAVGYVVG